MDRMGNAKKRVFKIMREDIRMTGRNQEGYPDPTAGEAIRESARMPTHIYNIFRALNTVAGLHGLEITEMRDRNTGKKFRKR